MKSKVLLITRPIAPPWDEASKNFAYNLAKKLDMKKFQLHLMTRGILPELPSEIIQEDVYTSSQDDFSFSQKVRALFFQFKVRKQFDIAHYFFTPTRLNSFLINNLLKNNKTKSIQTVATLREDLLSDEEIKDLMFADHIVTYSDYAKNKLISLGLSNVSRIYPGIDLNQYSPTPKDPEVLSKFKIQNSKFVISYPGEYHRLGATDMIVESLPEIFEKIPNANFIFACRVKNQKDARKKEEAVERLKEKNILDKVIFSDTFGDMAKLYNLSDVVIFPVGNMKGKFDVPLAVIEAMACEKPVIISDIPILQEFSNEKNSLHIEVGNRSALVEAVVSLYVDPEKRQEIGAYARRYVAQNFDIVNVAKQYEEIYNRQAVSRQP